MQLRAWSRRTRFAPNARSSFLHALHELVVRLSLSGLGLTSSHRRSGLGNDGGLGVLRYSASDPSRSAALDASAGPTGPLLTIAERSQNSSAALERASTV